MHTKTTITNEMKKNKKNNLELKKTKEIKIKIKNSKKIVMI
jgi:hypothetical protein